MVNHYRLNWLFCRLELETELLMYQGEKRWSARVKECAGGRSSG